MTWASFDRVFCLTMEGQLERQRLVSREFNKVGLTSFQFIEGIKANTRKVEKAYLSRRVSIFPPCFRCGKLECKCENNVLIKPQVACFLSYLKIFRAAKRSYDNTFLSFEDDIVFQNIKPGDLEDIFKAQMLDSLGFFSHTHPCLLGIGTATPLSKEQFSKQSIKWIQGDGSPSNTCFAFNRSFARLALAEYTKITTTVDIYIHRDLPQQKDCQSWALSPRLIFDRSWHEGSVSSTIHPKPQYLAKLDNQQIHAKEAARLKLHIKQTKVLTWGICGIPRGGTGWAAAAATKLGWDIGHEAAMADGISSWMLAAPTQEKAPFGKENTR